MGVWLGPLTVVAVINDLSTWRDKSAHFVSVTLHPHFVAGEPRNLESDKCEGRIWVDLEPLPLSHFRASALSLQCWLGREHTATG